MVYNMVMYQVNISEAKAQLSELIERAAEGEEIVICNRNVPVASLKSIEPRRKPDRKLGAWKGRFAVPADFNAPLSTEEIAEWEHPIE
jgi:prevent-host-death family protein